MHQDMQRLTDTLLHLKQTQPLLPRSEESSFILGRMAEGHPRHSTELPAWLPAPGPGSAAQRESGSVTSGARGPRPGRPPASGV